MKPETIESGSPAIYLAFPRPDDIIFQSLPAGVSTASLSRYGDEAWYLWPMAKKDTVGKLKIDFTTLPPPYRDTARRLIWFTINHRTPIDALDRTSSIRDKLTAGAITAMFNLQRTFLRWLHDRGIAKLQSVTGNDFRAYADHVCSRSAGRHNKHQHLFGVTRMWLIAPYLPTKDQLSRPTWEDTSEPDDSLDALLGPPLSYAENATAPVHPQAMSALFLAALRFVEVFGQDILSAIDDRQRMRAGIPTRFDQSQKQRLEAYLRHLDQSGGGIPGTTMTGRRSKDEGKAVTLACDYLAATLGVTIGSVSKLRNAPLRLGTPMPTVITGRVDGKPWCDSIDYYEVALMRHYLMTACFIVVAYLSGMRAEECRALRRGCCAAAEPEPGTPDHYEIRGFSFKDARDDNGNTIPGGQEREHPWLAVEPVAKAIAMAESIHDGPYVFTDAHFRTRGGGANDRPISAELAGDCVTRFINWWNRHSETVGRNHEIIPKDPDGAISPLRFRRTLAWFIYRIPGGRIALGLQYGHLRAQTSDAYGSRVAHSARDVFVAEEALAAADTLHDAAQRVDSGEKVSGPAAARYINGALTYRRSFNGTFLTLGQMIALRRNPSMRIYDNAERAMACVYDQAKALCHPAREPGKSDEARTPDMTRCRDNCPNGARTDTHAEFLTREIGRLSDEVRNPLTPEPIRERITARIRRRQQELAEHHLNRRGKLHDE
jgi:hypothetical protein